MILISLIIPVYNVEKYIERCILSVLNQDLCDRCEIIIVNDGSTDKSMEIVSILTKNYNYVKIINQSNMGLGAARNTGILHSTGKFLWFIDSDDFIKGNILGILTDKIESLELDALYLSFNCTNESGELIDWIDINVNFEGKQVLSGPEYYFKNYIHSYIWLFIFKRNLFTRFEIFFKERINMQDSEILPRILNNVIRIGKFDEPVYFYVNRPDSFINNKSSLVRFNYYNSIIDVANYLFDFKQSLDDHSLMQTPLKNKLKLINKMLFLQFIYNDFDKNQLKKIILKLKKSKLFPFKPIVEKLFLKRLIYSGLRILINKYPFLTRKVYLIFR